MIHSTSKIHTSSCPSIHHGSSPCTMHQPRSKLQLYHHLYSSFESTSLELCLDTVSLSLRPGEDARAAATSAVPRHYLRPTLAHLVCYDSSPMAPTLAAAFGFVSCGSSSPSSSPIWPSPSSCQPHPRRQPRSCRDLPTVSFVTARGSATLLFVLGCASARVRWGDCSFSGGVQRKQEPHT